MTNPDPLQELACSHCGAPIKTTARPGTTVTCDCCGSAFAIPEQRPGGAATTAGVVIGPGVVVHGDGVGGDKIVAAGPILIAGPGARITVTGETGDDEPEASE